VTREDDTTRIPVTISMTPAEGVRFMKAIRRAQALGAKSEGEAAIQFVEAWLRDVARRFR
jgi:hypothetical protein